MFPCRELNGLSTNSVTHVRTGMKDPGGLYRDEEQRVKDSKDSDLITNGE